MFERSKFEEAVLASLTHIRIQLHFIKQKVDHMSDTVDTIDTETAEIEGDVLLLTTQINASVTAYQSLSGQLAAALEQVTAAGGLTSTQIANFQSIHNQLQLETSALAAATGTVSTGNTSTSTAPIATEGASTEVAADDANAADAPASTTTAATEADPEPEATTSAAPEPLS